MCGKPTGPVSEVKLCCTWKSVRGKRPHGRGVFSFTGTLTLLSRAKQREELQGRFNFQGPGKVKNKYMKK